MSERKATIRWGIGETYDNSDCACPSTDWAASQSALDDAASWHLSDDLYRVPLPQHHELAFNPTDPSRLAVLNESAVRVLDSFGTPGPLSTTADRQIAASGLLVSDCRTSPVTASALHTLTVWLHVTNACNLRCPYCYVHKSDEGMSEATGKAAIDSVFCSAVANGFRAVKVKYAGGEPMLNFPLVRALHGKAKLLSSQCGLDLRAVVLSNGTMLTDEMIDWLLGEDVRLMISLDGVGAVHDAQRPFADGRGSFALVARNIDRAVVRGLSPYISITVTPQSAKGLPDAVRFALERDLLFNLNFVREPCGVGCEVPIGYASMIRGIREALSVIEGNLPNWGVIGGLMDRATLGVPHRYPCGAGRDYLVVDHRGQISRCQMTMDQPVTDIGDEDPLRAAREWEGGFQNIAVEEKDGCSDCIWRYWCAGGCPLLAYRAADRSDTPSPYCDVYKTLYPDLLRLEGLRLLKTAPPT